MSATRSEPTRSAVKWAVCALLLFATALNYMDRQTLASAAARVIAELKLTKEQFGELELAFGWAFAAGSVVFGFLADRLPVRWLYPSLIALWSLMGFVSSFAPGHRELLWCRALLGFFEAGHWPCALKTTHALLTVEGRMMGNSVLQSGASVGAIITPLLVRALMGEEPGAWRLPFQVVGALGVFWIGAWFLVDHKRLALATIPGVAAIEDHNKPVSDGVAKRLMRRRLLVALVVVLCIHTAWQFLRVWLPLFLQKGRGYTESQALLFNSFYFGATDAGCLLAGAASVWLCNRGRAPHAARSMVFLVCALLTALSLCVVLLPKGWALLGVLLLVGAGALGLFPCYYSLIQEISPGHVGKVTGLLGMLAWAITSPVHKYFGRLVDRTGSFELGIGVVGLLPLLAWLVQKVFRPAEDSPGHGQGMAGMQKSG